MIVYYGMVKGIMISVDLQNLNPLTKLISNLVVGIERTISSIAAFALFLLGTFCCLILFKYLPFATSVAKSEIFIKI